MAQRKVIYLKSESKSFAYNDGLFAVMSENGDSIELAKLGPDGHPMRYHDNKKLVIVLTSIRNPGIHKTPLTIEIE